MENYEKLIEELLKADTPKGRYDYLVWLIHNQKEAKIEKFSFKKAMINYGFSENLVNDWIDVRKTKKATNSETAFKRFISEIEKRTCNLDQVLELIVSKSWSGFEWEWIDKTNNSNANNKTGKQEKFAEYFKQKSKQSGISY